MSDKELSKRYRDLLNSIISTVVGDDQESEIVRCCLAVSVEELEDYIYDGKFTPSVRPASSTPVAASSSTVQVSMPELELDDEEMKMAVTGRKIEAIKQFRSRRGCDLLDAKNIVEAFIEFAKPTKEEIDLALKPPGYKISAIKAYRTRTKLGLKFSKDAIEEGMASR